MDNTLLNPLKESDDSTIYDDSISSYITFDKHVVGTISIMFGIAVLVIVIYSMYLTFDYTAFWFAALITICIFIIKPTILESLRKKPILQYYSLFLTFSLVMALDDFKNSSNYLFLIIVNMILSVISYLTRLKWFIAISIALNIYVLSLVAVMYKNNSFVSED